MDLQQIRQDIDGDLEDARFLAFMKLYTSTDPEAKAEINRIVEQRDPVVKLLFLRFLSYVPEKLATQYICRLLEDDNTVVVEAAKRAFEKNHFEGRLDVLMSFIDSKKAEAQQFAIEFVGYKGRLDAVGPLLALINGAGESLLITILTALRHIPSSQSVLPMLDLLKDPREEIRFRATLVCGELFESETRLLRHPLLALLKDPDGHVRRAAVWGLRRRPMRGDEKILVEVGTQDPDPMVRQEAVGGLVDYPTADVILKLLEMLASEKDRRVSLKCESALLSMPRKALVKGLESVLSHTKGEVRHKAILLAADYQRGSDGYFDFLIKGLQSVSSDKERIAYLEALGVFGDSRAIPVLLHYVYGPPLLAYVAVSSLLKVSSDPGLYLEYLENPKGSQLIKQVILRYFLRRPYVALSCQDRVVSCLISMLKEDNINMRYLAAQVLVHISGKEAQGVLLEAVNVETDQSSLRLLRNSLAKFFIDDPKGYVSQLIIYRSNDVLFRELVNLLPEIIWSRGEFLEVLPDMLSDSLVVGDEAYRQACVEWVANYVLQGRVFLEDVLSIFEKVPNSDALVVDLVRIILKHPHVNIVISQKTCRYWIQSKSDEVRSSIVDLMGMSRDVANIPVLVSVICKSEWSFLREKAAKALGQMTMERT